MPTLGSFRDSGNVTSIRAPPAAHMVCSVYSIYHFWARSQAALPLPLHGLWVEVTAAWTSPGLHGAPGWVNRGTNTLPKSQQNVEEMSPAQPTFVVATVWTGASRSLGSLFEAGTQGPPLEELGSLTSHTQGWLTTSAH